MKTTCLINGTELKNITAKNKWVLVKFSAVWCEPCRLLAPVFNTVTEQYTELQAVTVNVDLQPALVRDYSIHSVPTLLLFKQGEVVSQLLGVKTESQLNTWLDQNIQPI